MSIPRLVHLVLGTLLACGLVPAALHSQTPSDNRSIVIEVSGSARKASYRIAGEEPTSLETLAKRVHELASKDARIFEHPPTPFGDPLPPPETTSNKALLISASASTPWPSIAALLAALGNLKASTGKDAALHVPEVKLAVRGHDLEVSIAGSSDFGRTKYFFRCIPGTKRKDPSLRPLHGARLRNFRLASRLKISKQKSGYQLLDERGFFSRGKLKKSGAIVSFSDDLTVAQVALVLRKAPAHCPFNLSEMLRLRSRSLRLGALDGGPAIGIGGGGARFGFKAGGRRNLRAFGGGGRSERSVTNALGWLARQQGADGSWRGDVESTALAVFCFLGSGHTHVDGAHRSVVRNGLLWLMKQQQDDGSFAAREAPRLSFANLISTLTLLEAHGTTRATVLRDRAE